jgi:hypothetical protein
MPYIFPQGYVRIAFLHIGGNEPSCLANRGEFKSDGANRAGIIQEGREGHALRKVTNVLRTGEDVLPALGARPGNALLPGSRRHGLRPPGRDP